MVDDGVAVVAQVLQCGGGFEGGYDPVCAILDDAEGRYVWVALGCEGGDDGFADNNRAS